MKLQLGFAILAATPFASAFSGIGDFNGSASEDFESFQHYNQIGSSGYNPLSIMGGAATFSNTGDYAQTWVYNPGDGATWNLGVNGYALTFDHQAAGLFAGGEEEVSVMLTFDQVATKFGGHFATATDSFTPDALNFDFYDADNNLIGSDSVVTGSNAFVWKGWEHAAGIKSIHMFGGLGPVMDNLQANPVPEPGTLAALALGLAALRRKRN